MAADQHLALLAIANRKAWLAIVMGRTARDPTGAHPSTTEGLCNRLSGYGLPPRLVACADG